MLLCKNVVCSFLHGSAGIFSVFRDKCLNFALYDGRSKFQKAPFVTHGPSRMELFGPPPSPPQLVKSILITVRLRAFKDRVSMLFFICIYSGAP